MCQGVQVEEAHEPALALPLGRTGPCNNPPAFCKLIFVIAVDVRAIFVFMTYERSSRSIPGLLERSMGETFAQQPSGALWKSE